MAQEEARIASRIAPGAPSNLVMRALRSQGRVVTDTSREPLRSAPRAPTKRSIAPSRYWRILKGLRQWDRAYTAQSHT